VKAEGHAERLTGATGPYPVDDQLVCFATQDGPEPRRAHAPPPSMARRGDDDHVRLSAEQQAVADPHLSRPPQLGRQVTKQLVVVDTRIHVAVAAAAAAADRDHTLVVNRRGQLHHLTR
jgi:hypothetical protein